MGIVEKFTAFSEEDMQNVTNNVFIMMIIILLCVVTDIPCSCLFNIIISPRRLSHIFFPKYLVFFFWLRKDLSIVVG